MLKLLLSPCLWLLLVPLAGCGPSREPAKLAPASVEQQRQADEAQINAEASHRATP